MLPVDPIIILTLRSAVMLLFATAVLHKLWNAVAFERVVARYLEGFRAGGYGFEKPLLIIVVGLELGILGACLLSSARTTGLLASGTLLLYAFTMAVNLYRGNVLVDCGCNWGSSHQALRPALVVRNVVLAVLVLLLLLPVGTRELAVVDIVSVIIATLTAMFLYTAGNRLLSIDISERSELT